MKLDIKNKNVAETTPLGDSLRLTSKLVISSNIKILVLFTLKSTKFLKTHLENRIDTVQPVPQPPAHAQ